MASVDLVLQSPRPDDRSSDLQERLLDACHDAASGGGVFAWANYGGAAALLGDEVFVRFLRSGTFDLIVGLDSITDTRALEFLRDRIDRHPNLYVRALCHDERALFHPKLAWFQAPDGTVTLLVGSGNLTLSGLKDNWEAFTVTQLEGVEATDVSRKVEEWLESLRPWLRELDDPEVDRRAARNTGRERDVTRVGKAPAPTAVPPAADNEVLVTEISKGGRNMQQADVRLNAFVGFFGAERRADRDASQGLERRIVFHHVEEGGSLGHAENRPAIETESRNFRFELDAGKGIPYPDEGRPIGVFLKVAARRFLYRLVLPGDPAHGPLTRFLERDPDQPPRNMREAQGTAERVRAVWPDSPLWQASLEEL